MYFKKSPIFIFSLVLAVYSLSALAKKQDWPEVTEDGLHRVSHILRGPGVTDPEMAEAITEARHCKVNDVSAVCYVTVFALVVQMDNVKSKAETTGTRDRWRLHDMQH